MIGVTVQPVGRDFRALQHFDQLPLELLPYGGTELLPFLPCGGKKFQLWT